MPCTEIRFLQGCYEVDVAPSVDPHQGGPELIQLPNSAGHSTEAQSYDVSSIQTSSDIQKIWRKRATKTCGCVWKCCVSLNPMVLLIIIPIKWLFHWEYTLFSDKPMWRKRLCLLLKFVNLFSKKNQVDIYQWFSMTDMIYYDMPLKYPFITDTSINGSIYIIYIYIYQWHIIIYQYIYIYMSFVMACILRVTTVVSFRGGGLPSPTVTTGWRLGSDIEVTGNEIRKPSTSWSSWVWDFLVLYQLYTEVTFSECQIPKFPNSQRHFSWFSWFQLIQ